MLKRGFAILMTLCLLLALPVNVALAAETEGSTVSTDMADIQLPGNAGNHWVNANGTNHSPGRSFLYANEKGGLTVVAYRSASVGVCVVEVDEDLRFLNTRTLPVTDLYRWGGFCAGETYNYVVYTTSKTDLRVDRYTKDWTLSATRTHSFSNTNGLISNDMELVESGGNLFIATNHTMTNGHQANMRLQIHGESLNLSVNHSGTSHFGYCSHSFVPEIAAKNGRIYVFDRSDTYPGAAIWLHGYNGSFSSGSLNRSVCSMEFRDWGNIGGAAATSSGALLAYNYAPYTQPYTNTNVFLYYSAFSGSSSSRQVSYSGGAGTPYVAPLSETSGFVLWNPDLRNRNEPNNRLYYAAYALNSGSLSVGPARSAEGHYLSDCTPILFKDKVTWYTYEGGEIQFHQIGAVGGVTRTAVHDPVELEPVAPTYTSVGYTGGTECSICGEVLTQPQEVPMVEVELESAQVRGDRLVVEFHGDGKETFQLAAAFYDAGKRFLGVELIACRDGDREVSVPLPEGGASYALFPMGGSHCPVGAFLRDHIS